ncbi:MAG: cysteine peptidase family C39 domain-containing protein [Arenicellales bacterium]
MSQIRLVKQKDDTGCGIACAAMVANCSYEKAKRMLMKQEGWKKLNRKVYTRARHIKPLLNKLGLKCEIKKSKSWKDYDGLSIVGVNSDEDGYFHWVVVIKDKKHFLIIDPSKGEIFNGAKRTKKKFIHRKSSMYISISSSVSNIKI